MADVMPRSHGGNGVEEPPPPGGFRRGHHEADLVPPKKTRGKAKNKKLQQATKEGRLVSIPFDRTATFNPVGSPSDMFIREVGIYIWANLHLIRTPISIILLQKGMPWKSISR